MATRRRGEAALAGVLSRFGGPLDLAACLYQLIERNRKIAYTLAGRMAYRIASRGARNADFADAFDAERVHVRIHFVHP